MKWNTKLFHIMNVYLFCGLSNLIKGRSKEYLILTSLFELKSPKFSLYSREKVGSFTTNVIFLENKNIKWPKKKTVNPWCFRAKQKYWMEPERGSVGQEAAGAGQPVVTLPLALWQGLLQSCWPRCSRLWASLCAGPLPGLCLIDVDLQVQRDPDSERFLSLPQLLTSTFERILYLFFAWF